MGNKRCPKCGETKTHDLFYNNKNAKDNCSPYCKVCSNLRTTSYARDHKGLISNIGYALKRRYGITAEEYVNILKDQDYKCKICGTDKCHTGRNFSVDHNHTTGKIRGLLCAHCNVGLGNFKDNTSILQKAINYLEQNDSK